LSSELSSNFLPAGKDFTIPPSNFLPAGNAIFGIAGKGTKMLKTPDFGSDQPPPIGQRGEACGNRDTGLL
jgi:hypothetical protein